MITTKPFFILTSFVVMAFGSVQAAKGQSPFRADARTPPLAGYRLAWSEDFDGTALDTNKWSYRTDSKHWSTQQPENVSVAEGILHIALRKEKARGKDYTGGGVISKRPFRYGYYEARFKVPPGAGWHTSFWTTRLDGSGSTTTNQAKQEIDICENDSQNLHQYHAAVHRWWPSHKGFGYKVADLPDLSAGFHVWGCEFRPQEVRFYFDGKLKHTVDVSAIPQNDQNIWLTAIASHLGGTKAVDDSRLPAVAEFDWVRFYEPEESSHR
jgi:beta-glucanase (GH16 family)